MGPVTRRIARGMKDLRRRDGHEHAVRLLPGIGAFEPAHELGAAEVGEDQAFAQPERRVGEDLHRLLLFAERAAQVPEVREALELLLRHEHQNLGQGRLPLEDRLRGGAAVVLALELDQRVEVQVLVLQGVHQLVRDHEPRLAGVDVGGEIERVGVGVEVPRDLLGEEIGHGAPQVERVGDQAEQPVGGLRAGELGGREVVVELVNDVVANLGPAAAQHHRAPLEHETDRALDGRHHLLHGLLQLGLALDLLGPLLASSITHPRQSGRHGGREPPPSHPCHSIPFPTAAPTTRAMS